MKASLRSLLLLSILLPATGASADPSIHVVASGDSLGALALRYHTSLEELRAWNALEDDVIRVGQELRVSDPRPVVRYRTIPGDTLGCIASRFEVPLERLVEDNPDVSRRLEVGLELVIRGGVDPREDEATVDVVVAEGETLSAIAERHGVSLEALVALNRDLEGDLDPDHVRAGTRLVAPAPSSLTVRVASGETLGRIARRHDVSVAQILEWNPDVRPDRLRVGEELTLRGRRRSESVGAANCGQVRGSEQLGEHPAYVLRNPARAWATARTVARIGRGFDALHRAYPQAPRVRVHDLGLRGGGPIDDHRSHQSGRDVDLTYYQRDGCSSSDGCPLGRVDPENLDTRREWTLLREWLRRGDVEAIYVDYALQPALYREARRRGATAEQLGEWFQYPRGRFHAEGRVRHFPNHRDHLHVRFACDASETDCH